MSKRQWRWRQRSWNTLRLLVTINVCVFLQIWLLMRPDFWAQHWGSRILQSLKIYTYHCLGKNFLGRIMWFTFNCGSTVCHTIYTVIVRNASFLKQWFITFMWIESFLFVSCLYSNDKRKRFFPWSRCVCIIIYWNPEVLGTVKSLQIIQDPGIGCRHSHCHVHLIDSRYWTYALYTRTRFHGEWDEAVISRSHILMGNLYSR